MNKNEAAFIALKKLDFATEDCLRAVIALRWKALRDFSRFIHFSHTAVCAVLRGEPSFPGVKKEIVRTLGFDPWATRLGDTGTWEEKIAIQVHNAWWIEKLKQGFHSPTSCPIAGGEKFEKHCDRCHTDMYPYVELPEHVKEYDRVTVKTVLDAIENI